eukprot:tig00020996_g16928.t1
MAPCHPRPVGYVVLVLVLLGDVCRAQITKPVASSKKVPSAGGEKFLQGPDVMRIEDVIFGTDATKFGSRANTTISKFTGGLFFESSSQCGVDIDPLWTAEVDASVYATPIIADLSSDGRKSVAVATFVRSIELLSGSDGERRPGWPYAFTSASFHGSPLAYDVDEDGSLEVLVVTANAEVVFLREDGLPLVERTMRVPRLRVRKDWYVGIDESKGHEWDGASALGAHSSHGEAHRHAEMPEPRTGNVVPSAPLERAPPPPPPPSPAKEEVAPPPPPPPKVEEVPPPPPPQPPPAAPATEEPAAAPAEGKAPAPPAPQRRSRRRRLPLRRPLPPRRARGRPRSAGAGPGGSLGARAGGGSGGRAAAAGRGGARGERPETPAAPAAQGEAAAAAPQEAQRQPPQPPARRRRLSQYDDSELPIDLAAPIPADEATPEELEAVKKTVSGGQELSDEALASWQVFKASAGGSLQKQRVPVDSLWDTLAQTYGEQQHKEGYVDVDPHVLCTPLIADVDGDGSDELVLAVSFYFDREHYADPARAKELDPGLQLTKYVAGGIAVLDLATGKLKWLEHLDLTTDETQYRAYMYSSPSVGDVDGDGRVEVVVGTSAGWLYALDGAGKTKPGFPIEMAEIQGQVTLADLNADGALELIAVDSRGNVAVFNGRGEELWDRRLIGLAAQPPSVGDVDGDGVLDVVVGTDSGVLWAMSGDDGRDLPHFPLRTEDRILAPAALLRLGAAAGPGYHVVVPSFDGHVYVAHGPTGCVQRVDLGENSYSLVLADELRAGSGKLALLVSTMNGVLYAFGTNTPFHPLKAIPAQGFGRTGFVAREGYLGVHVLPQSRRYRDLFGRSFVLWFEITDERKPTARERAAYTVRARLAGRRVLATATFSSPGVHSIEIPVPSTRSRTTLVLEMVNEQGLHFSDAVPVSLNLYFYRTLKYALLVPFLLASLVLLLSDDIRVPLPA